MTELTLSSKRKRQREGDRWRSARSRETRTKQILTDHQKPFRNLVQRSMITQQDAMDDVTPTCRTLVTAGQRKQTP